VKIELLRKNGDGGDSCNRTCAAALSYIYDNDAVDVSFLTKLHHSWLPFLWRRAPDFGFWYSDWNRMSRDQTVPLLILMGEKCLYGKLAWYLFGHLIRLMLFTHNTRKNFQYRTLEEHLVKSTPDVKWDYSWKLPDVTGPEFWALEIRAMPKPIRMALWPLLCVLDLETFAGSIVRRWLRPENNDVINHTLVLINGRRRCPTPLMYLARKITPRSFLQPRLDSFFSEPGEPSLNTMLYLAVWKYL
jgi:hypothetical protein